MSRVRSLSAAGRLACSILLLTAWPAARLHAAVPTVEPRVEEVCNCIRQKDLAKADEKLTAFLADFSSDERLPEFLSTIAVRCNRTGDHQKAAELCRYALDHAAPGNKRRLLAEAGRLLSGLPGDEDPNTIQVRTEERLTEIEALLTENAGNPFLPQAVFQAAEHFHFRAREALGRGRREQAQADFRRAIALWDRNRTQTADPLHRAHAAYYSAAAYRRLGDHEAALKCWLEVVRDHPDYEKAWFARFMAARCCEELGQKGGFTPEDVKAAYRLVIDKDPNSPAAPTAAASLNWL